MIRSFKDVLIQNVTLNPRRASVERADPTKGSRGLDRATGDINEGNPNRLKSAITKSPGKAMDYRAMLAKKSDSVALGKKVKDAAIVKLMVKGMGAPQLGQGGAIYAESDLLPEPTRNRSVKKS